MIAVLTGGDEQKKNEPKPLQDAYCETCKATMKRDCATCKPFARTLGGKEKHG